MGFIESLQEKPERTRKIVLWTIVVIVALLLMGIWLWDMNRALQALRKQPFVEKLHLEELKAEIKEDTSLLELEFPQEQLEALEQDLEELQKLHEEETLPEDPLPQEETEADNNAK